MKVVLLLILACTASLPGHAAGIDGKWTSEHEMSEMNGRSLEITDGKVDGDKFSFRVKLAMKQGERSAIYEGTVTGDQLKGTIKFRGIGITQPFEAKRTN